MRHFTYLAPTTLEEAITLLSKYEDRAKLLAGGTDLLVQAKRQEIKPEAVIDLKHIPDLNTIRHDNEGLKMGALVSIRDIELSQIVEERFNILKQAAETLGSVQVRNRATIGGNICRAAPSADMIPALIGLNATVKIAGQDGEWFLPLEEFFKAPGMTAMKAGEILTEIQVPNLADFSDGVYLKMSPRRAMDLAVVGVASILTMDRTISRCLAISIVLGAVAPTPIRAKEAEAALSGSELSDSLIAQAAEIAAEQAQPISDVRAPDWYRREIVKVLVNRSVHQALARIKMKRGRR